MHELGIAENIAKIVSAEIKDRPVLSITFKTGRLGAVIPESLKLCWDAVKKDYEMLKDAELVVIAVGVKIFCAACNENFEIEEPIFACRKCGGAVKVIEGDTMWIESVRI